ncbi:MAG: hypothetical protein RL701_3648 [Pseudomonadota bacterium]|jgi:hypothetical protein
MDYQTKKRIASARRIVTWTFLYAVASFAAFDMIVHGGFRAVTG